MADDYIQLPFVTDETQLADDAIANLQSRWDDWTPNDADQESIFIEELAPMAATLATIAAAMPPEALYTAGQLLFQVPPLIAIAAQTTVALTADLGCTVYAGDQIQIDGYAFSVISDVDIPAASTGYEPAGYYKDRLGTVHLRGVITTGTNGTTAFTLPAGFRPAAYVGNYSVITSGGGNVVNINGGTGVVTPSVGGAGWTSLAGITFLAEN